MSQFIIRGAAEVDHLRLNFVNRSALQMRCQHLAFLAAEFDIASKRFRDAREAWENCHDIGARLMVADWVLSEARLRYEVARLSLEKHAAKHGCFTVSYFREGQ